MKRLIVTGGGRGIGAEIARQASHAGYRVGIIDQDLDGDLESSAGQALPQSAASLQLLPADVTDGAAVQAAIQPFGGCDAFVNCAGILRAGSLLELSEEDFASVLQVNLTGTFVAAREAARSMLESGGAIVNLSSINAAQPSPAAGAYVAAKAGVEALTRQMSLEWAVNAVAPGFVDAGMAAPFYQDAAVRQARTAAVPAGRLGQAADIAQAVLFLLSEAASYISGQTLSVDGALGHSALHGLARQ